MHRLWIIFSLFFSFFLINSAWSEPISRDEAIEAFKKLQNPGKLYQGQSQGHKESEDNGAAKTKEITKSMAGSDINNALVEDAIKTQKKEMRQWAQENKNMKVLDPFKTIP
ncbi:MAG: hypothetical protein V2B19_16395 [Pseudomonadota bacterium]